MKKVFSFLVGLCCLYLAFALYEKENPKEVLHSSGADTNAVIEQNTPQALASTAAASQPRNVSSMKTLSLSSGEAKIFKNILSYFEKQNFEAALKLAESTLEKNPSKTFKTWLLSELPNMLITSGWKALKNGDCDSAIAYLSRSEEFNPSKESAKGLAFCFAHQKNFAAAERYLQWLLQDNTKDTDVLLLNAEVMESLGQFEGGLSSLIKIKELSEKADDVLESKIQSMRQKLKSSQDQESWTRANFKLTFSNQDHQSIANEVLEILEISLGQHVERFGFREPASPIEVIIYPSESFREVIGGAPNWVEGLFDGRMRVPIHPSWIKDHNLVNLRIVLRHELVHALLAQMSDGLSIPPWFHEGLAQRASCTSEPCPVFVFPPGKVEFLEASKFEKSFTLQDSKTAQFLYQQSLYLVLILEQGRGGIRVLLEKIDRNSAHTSDGLLKPLEMTFFELWTRAKTQWDQRISPELSPPF